MKFDLIKIIVQCCYYQAPNRYEVCFIRLCYTNFLYYILYIIILLKSKKLLDSFLLRLIPLNKLITIFFLKTALESWSHHRLSIPKKSKDRSCKLLYINYYYVINQYSRRSINSYTLLYQDHKHVNWWPKRGGSYKNIITSLQNKKNNFPNLKI